MKKHGFLKILPVILVGAIVLQSCDMGKYYFRMHPGGKSQQPRNFVREESNSLSFSASEEKAIRHVNRDTVIENESTDSPISANTIETNVQKPAVRKNTDPQPRLANESSEQVSSVKAKKQQEVPRTSGDESVLMIFALILAFVVGICLLVFLVAWIFAPALVALRIALWTFAGISLLVLIGGIRAITMT